MPSNSSSYVNEQQADWIGTRNKLQSVTMKIFNVKYIELTIISTQSYIITDYL